MILLERSTDDRFLIYWIILLNLKTRIRGLTVIRPKRAACWLVYVDYACVTTTNTCTMGSPCCPFWQGLQKDPAKMVWDLNFTRETYIFSNCSLLFPLRDSDDDKTYLESLARNQCFPNPESVNNLTSELGIDTSKTCSFLEELKWVHESTWFLSYCYFATLRQC